MFDALHRILSGQTLTPRELRIAGIVVLLWFVMDTVQWLDWFGEKLFGGKESHVVAFDGCDPGFIVALRHDRIVCVDPR